MSLSKHAPPPVLLGPHRKYDVRTQFGALCWRMKKKGVEVALVTSRGTKRWGVPKGWPMDGATPASAAAQEAYEEAGLKGRVDNLCLGIYTYQKNMGDRTIPCVVAIFPVKVKKTLSTWPEAKDRKRKWLSLKKAAGMVEYPELKRILREFDPKLLDRKPN